MKTLTTPRQIRFNAIPPDKRDDKVIRRTILLDANGGSKSEKTKSKKQTDPLLKRALATKTIQLDFTGYNAEQLKTLDREKVKAEINTWKPKAKEIMFDAKGQVFYCFFDKALNTKGLSVYNEFFVKKNSFERHLVKTAKYLNYFVNKFDTDNELITAYAKLKFAVDKYKMYDASNPHAFIDLIYELIFTPTMCEKICRMVDVNYLDDIESGRGKYKAGGNQYTKSLEFTNEHQKILLRISVGMRIVSVIMYHYFTVNGIKPTELENRQKITIVYDFYHPLFKLLSGEVNMFNKLFVYIQRKVIDSSYHNQKIFTQREILGDDTYTLIERFIKTSIITDNMVKYEFNCVWDPRKKKYKENIIGFNKTIMKYQLYYFLKETYGKTLAEATNTINSEGLSGADKMEMNLTKLDIGILNQAELNVEYTMNRIQKQQDVPLTDEEIQYYRDNHYPSDIQVHLVRSHYSRYFSSYREENLLNRKEYNILLLILKKRLLLENGYGSDDLGENVYLPYILTGNLEGKANIKPLKDAELNSQLEQDPIYDYLVNVKYKELEELKPGYIKGIISTFIGSKFTYVCYEEPKLTGQLIDAPAAQLASELLRFLWKI